MSDLIDRQAVIDLLKQMRKDGDMVPWEGKDVFARIRKLPTIQPEKAQLSKEGTTKDTISRQAALEKVRAMQTYKLFIGDDMILVDKAEVQTELMMLPPAQSEPKEGYWKDAYFMGEYECSVCGYYEIDAYDFCPHCGAKMKG